MEQELQSQHLFDLQVDQQASQYLSDAAKWAKFLSIVGFILSGIMVIAALFAGSMLSSLPQMEGMETIGGGAITAVYLFGALVWFFPCLYLYRFSEKAQTAIRSTEQQTLNNSFKNLKSCFRFMGIFTIVMLCLYAIVFVVAIGMALVS